MKTKTLFSAAILISGLATSFAQTNVYSENVYGYINLNLCTGFNLVADQLLFNGAGSNNTVHSVFGTSLPSGSAVYAFAGGAFANPPATYGTKGGWTGNTNAVNVALRPGGGVFIQTPSATTVTFVGDVPQGNLSTPYPAGYSIISSQVPRSGGMQSVLGFVPPPGATVFEFGLCGEPGGGGYRPPFSYGTKGGWQPSEPILAVGEAVFLQSPSSGAWARNFSVQ